MEQEFLDVMGKGAVIDRAIKKYRHAKMQRRRRKSREKEPAFLKTASKISQRFPGKDYCSNDAYKMQKNPILEIGQQKNI